MIRSNTSGVSGVIPHALRVNDRDGPLRADSQAVGFAAVDPRFSSHQSEFLQSPFQKLPRRRTLFARAAFASVGSAQRNMWRLNFPDPANRRPLSRLKQFEQSYATRSLPLGVLPRQQWRFSKAERPSRYGCTPTR